MYDQQYSNVFVLPAMVSNTLVSTFSSSRTDSSTVSTLGSFSLARASNSYNSRRVSVGSAGELPMNSCFIKKAKSVIVVLSG